MSQTPDQAVTRHAFATTPSTPLIWLADSTRQDRPIGLEALPDDDQSELVEAGEQSGQGQRM
jgi:hypothetical protein